MTSRMPLLRPLADERLQLGRRTVDLRVMVNRRARRIILRVDPVSGDLVLVLPSARTYAEGLDFVRQKAEWTSRRLEQVPNRVAFADGAIIPVQGLPHRITHDPDLLVHVRQEEGELQVGGLRRGMSPRVGAWLRAEARRTITRRAAGDAERLDVEVTRISIRDPHTRWGSASCSGALSFSWRLYLAPKPVLNYVVAHEVAHLREMNHGPRFWRLVESLCPRFEQPRAWLRDQGQSLHRYG
jgi:predicted metal-dependent hydrolase